MLKRLEQRRRVLVCEADAVIGDNESPGSFLSRRAGMSRLDAYSLASIAVSFRVTQFVDQTRGIHAMIPKRLFV